MKGIEIKNLSVYGDQTEVLKDVGFTVEAGKVFAVLGKSDKAKRLLLRLTQKYLQNSACYIEAENIANKYYTLPANRPFGFFSVLDYMQYIFSANQGSRAQKLQSFIQILGDLGIEKYRKTKIKLLKPVELKLVNLAVSLYRKPEAIIIDADDLPTDRRTKTMLNNALTSLKNKGYAIVVAMDVSMAGSAVDLLGVLKNGKMAALGTPNQIAALEGRSVYSISSKSDLSELKQKFENLKAAQKIKMSGNKILVYTNDEDTLGADILELCSREGVAVKRLTLRSPSLKKSVQKLTK